ncbi:MAG: (Fe-S)-binding protein [Planctomycetes bacterium]|nr:(Fe-S)-binding protein [Planctomycetota bacterium]
MNALERLGAYARSLDCVHCGLCIESCPTYTLLGRETDSPRGRIYLMRALAEERIEDPTAVRGPLDRCLGCRACETVCPSGVRYGQLLETVRAELPRPRGVGARVRRALLVHLVAEPARLRLAFTLARFAERVGLRALARTIGILPRRADRLVPEVPPGEQRRPLTGVHRPDGAVRGRVQLFTGCVMEQVFGDINRATRDLLVANGFEVEVPAGQVCCGALHRHDGLADAADRLLAANIAAFRGDAPIVHNSAGCGAALSEYGEHRESDDAREFSSRCRDVTEFLAEVGLIAEPAPFPRRVAYDAPCHLSHAQGVRQQPIDLLRRVPGLELVEHAGRETCCGSAGIYNLLQPDIAERIGAAKAEALVGSGAEVVATGNPGCMMQIRAHLAARGAAIRTLHPVALLLPRDNLRSSSATLGSE